MSVRRPQQGDGFFTDSEDPDSQLGAFVWGVLFGCLGAFVALWFLGVLS